MAAASTTEYEEQLEAVDAALAKDPTNEEWRRLRVDLLEVIALKQQLTAVKGEASAALKAAPADVSNLRSYAIGDKCQAVFEGDGQWYNAKVVALSEDGYFVVYLGFGNTAQVEFTEVRPYVRPDTSDWRPGADCSAIAVADGRWYEASIVSVKPTVAVVRFTGEQETQEVCGDRTPRSRTNSQAPARWHATPHTLMARARCVIHPYAPVCTCAPACRRWSSIRSACERWRPRRHSRRPRARRQARRMPSCRSKWRSVPTTRRRWWRARRRSSTCTNARCAFGACAAGRARRRAACAPHFLFWTVPCAHDMCSSTAWTQEKKEKEEKAGDDRRNSWLSFQKKNKTISKAKNWHDPNWDPTRDRGIEAAREREIRQHGGK